MTGVEQLLAEAGRRVRAARRPFDAGAGLRQLAQDAGYLAPAGGVPAVSRARHELSVLARWTLKRAGAADYVERLIKVVGKHGSEHCEAWLAESDVAGAIDGAHVFACMLYVAEHPESAQFWWQLAAGAGNRPAAFCLHLHHLGLGEMAEAGLWYEQLTETEPDWPGDEFFSFWSRFTDYVSRYHPPSWEPRLNREVQRLATREDAECILVCRPEREIADRLQHCRH